MNATAHHRFQVGDFILWKGEDGTVVKVSHRSGARVTVAFDMDHVVFFRGSDGEYRADGSPLGNMDTLSHFDIEGWA